MTSRRGSPPSAIGRSACLAAALALALAGAGAAGTRAAGPAPRTWGQRPSVAELTALGRAIFGDAGLSADGRMACSSCHDPAAGFGPGARTPGALADGAPSHQGRRAIPGLRYVQFTPRFREHPVDDEGPGGGPAGGLTWDGRVDTVREQALLPLFAADEMANADRASLARRLAAAPYAARLRGAFSPPGGDVFDDARRTVDWLVYALEVYLQSPAFRPFDSKYDRVLAGQAELSGQELRGLRLYMDPGKGNCQACHPVTRAPGGAAPLMTDHGLVAIAPPRRPGLAPIAAGDAGGAEVDLGLCRSGRPGLSADAGWCGRFRTPTLRNAAVRTTFFHNGSLHSLREVVAFYATRDADPGRWYGRNPDGSVHAYDDLPAEFAASVERGAPFEPLPGGRARLDEREIDDLVAFLETFTDADLVPRTRLTAP